MTIIAMVFAVGWVLIERGLDGFNAQEAAKTAATPCCEDAHRERLLQHKRDRGEQYE